MKDLKIFTNNIEESAREQIDLLLEQEVKKLRNQLQQKENIIKEVREYIKTKYIAQGVLISYEVNDLLNELLEILDKVNREDK